MWVWVAFCSISNYVYIVHLHVRICLERSMSWVRIPPRVVSGCVPLLCLLCHIHENISEPQLPRLQTAPRPRCQPVTHCAGRVAANTRPHQLCWSNRECGCYMSCTCNTCACVPAWSFPLHSTVTVHCKNC